MDVKSSSQLNKKPTGSGNIPEVVIRTMGKDLAMLQGKGGPVKSDLSISKPVLEQKPKPVGFQPMVQLKKPGAPVPPEALPVAEPAKKLDFAARPSPTPTPTLTLTPAPTPITTSTPRPAPAPHPAPLFSKLEPIKPPIRPLKFVLIGLVALIIVAGLGGFFYWWNYLRVPPAPLTHLECQNSQCLEVQGEGTDQCQNNNDCAPVEPDVPESFIPVDETKTIELAIGEESSIFDEVKAVSSQSQTSSTFKRLLIKLSSQTEKKYADLDTIIDGLGIKLPITIQGEDYTLFLYGQAQGNRLGLILDTAESSSLVQDMKNWEQTIITDLAPLLLQEQTPTPFTEAFQDNVYQSIAIRYINFPNPDLSIDYAIVVNKLVITTSRESMFAAIDKLLTAKIDISDWQTYRNEEYGFEVKHPKEFNSVADTDGISIEILRGNDKNRYNLIGAYILKDKNTEEKCLIKTALESQNQGFSLSTNKENINGIVLHHFVNYPEYIGAFCGMSSGCQYQDIYRIFNKGNCFQIEYGRSDRIYSEPDNYRQATEEEMKVPDIFDQILFTFKFIE